jgi:hypothetical protein
MPAALLRKRFFQSLKSTAAVLAGLTLAAPLAVAGN